jgi:hypothetical protein
MPSRRSRKSAEAGGTLTTTAAASLEDLERIEQMLRWITTGASYSEIIKTAAATWPDKDAPKLYRLAVDQLQTAGNADPAIIRGFAIEASRELYRRLVENGDLTNALRALKLLYDFQG